jgi:hypothetical protein
MFRQKNSDFIIQFNEAADESKGNCINQCPTSDPDVTAERRINLIRFALFTDRQTDRIRISKLNFSVWRGREKQLVEGEGARDAVFKGEGKKISGFEGSQAVPTRPSGTGTFEKCRR